MPTGTGVADPFTLAQLIRDYGPVVAWILVVIGWIIGNHQANKREDRKEARAELDCFREEVKDLVTDYRLYLETDLPEAQRHAVTVLAGINRLAAASDRLAKRLDDNAVSTQMGDFFERVTGGDFDSSTHKASVGDPRLVTATAHGERMIAAAESAFLTKFG